MTARSNRQDQDVLGQAMTATQDALQRVTQIAIVEIRDRLEISGHVEAAERDLRSALRQLVLAQRTARSSAGRDGDPDLASVTAGPSPALPLPAPVGLPAGAAIDNGSHSSV